MSDLGDLGEAVTSLLTDIVKTPNGRIGTIGAALTVGPGYYVLARDHPADQFVQLMFGSGFILVLLSAGMAIYARHAEGKERRVLPRSDVPVSTLSLELMRSLPGPVQLDEVDQIQPLPQDVQKSAARLLATVVRLRLREAAHDGDAGYYQDGAYHPRAGAGDVTEFTLE